MLSGLIWAVIVGLIAGWLAGKVMKGGGYGTLMDIVLETHPESLLHA